MPSTTTLRVAHPARWFGRLAFSAALIASGIAHAQVPLGTAATFAVLGGSTVTNTGATAIEGNLGVSPGTSVTGFPPGTVAPPFSIHANDALAVQAQSDLGVAYSALLLVPTDTTLTGTPLGGLTLTPGTYEFASSAALDGTLTLDAQGDPGAVFNFKIGSTLTTGTSSVVNVINGGSACRVFWQVGSSATLGTGSVFAGNVLANTSITVNTSVAVSGRVLAKNGAVTLDTNDVAICALPQPTLATQASPPATLGTAISDSATLGGGVSPTGTIVFNLFGPDDLLCEGISTFTSSAVVSGNGVYASGPVTPTNAGTWRWTAGYSGDAGNSPVVGTCNAPNESTILATVMPALSTLASDSAVIGNSVSDSATLSGGLNPTGALAFFLYGPGDPTCSGPSISTVVTVDGNGVYSSGSFTPAVAGTYRWIAIYSGDAANGQVVGACNAVNESVIITPAVTILSTAASGSVLVGGLITDSATLTGGVSPLGTITFELFAPGDLACSTPIGQSIVAVAGNGEYTSAPFLADAVGIYRWLANYGGDANNAPTANACNAAGEAVQVVPATPALVTTASPAVVLGGAVSDAATLAGGVNPTGTITFRLFGPDDAACTAIVYSTNTPVAGNGVYAAATFTPSAAGVYRWVASYSGDAANSATANPCNTAGESVVVSPANPVVITIASAGGSLGTAIHDTATVSGGIAPGGAIVFRLYGPGDAACTGGAAFTVSVPVAGNGSYVSAAYTPLAAGTYRWIAAYGGDAANAAVSGACNGPNESAVITPATPALVTTASAGVARGGAVTDSALLSGGVNPTGSILFQLYGPNDAVCASTPVFTTITAVNGNGSYSSAPFRPVAAGTYRWVASYAGDANNALTSGACNLANESVTVAKSISTFVTTASAGVVLGAGIWDTGILITGPGATGMITFRLYGPADAACTGTPVSVSTLEVTDAASFRSATFIPAFAGSYRWIADYSGDGDNSATLNACNAPGETVNVSAPGSAATTLSSSATPSATLGNSISDVALLAGGASPTGTISFLVYGPDDAACGGLPVFMSSISVIGNGSYASGPFTPHAPGVYRWIANYGGDTGNVGTSNTCNASGELSAISATTVVEPIPTVGNLALFLTTLGIALCAFGVLRSSASRASIRQMSSLRGRGRRSSN